MKNCESEKIIRFIDNPDKVFKYDTKNETDSTFIMRTLRCYRATEDKRIRDDSELHVQLLINNQLTDHEDIQPEYIYVRCWSIFESIDILILANRFLMDNNSLNGVAIISNVNKVDRLIREATNKFNQPSYRYEHRAIVYYDNNTRISDPNSVNHRIRFMKRNDFDVEQEYRFVFDTIRLQELQQIENPLILNVKAKDYIDKIISFGHVSSELPVYCKSRGITFERFKGLPSGKP